MLTQRFQNPDPSFWCGRRVLLTGHTGFKGSWLAFWLLDMGADVTGLALEPDPSPNLFRNLGLADRLNHQIGDIRNPATLRLAVEACHPEVVLHLAAQPLVRRSYGEPVSTWETNVMGTIHLLEALRPLTEPCTAVLITTDKVYRNNEWLYGYRENDPLGGHDPYSSSKAAAELAISSWRSSFCGGQSHQTPHLRIASARAGNVIGGGDWAPDRIVPDAMRALADARPIGVRNPGATRPWQHVLEPLGGYLHLAERLASAAEPAPLSSAFNFGPQLEANRSVRELVEESLRHWPGNWLDQSDPCSPHEANLLNLVIDKAYHQLGWSPRWTFTTTIERTVHWYRRFYESTAGALACCQDDLNHYLNSFSS
jgi:CDP-glucose 4,6-dehydratase